MKEFLPVAAVCLYLMLSCSIKTDRSDCPCRLSVEMNEPLPEMSLALFRDGVPLTEKTLCRNDFVSGVCTVDIVRGKYVFSVSSGRNVIAEGEQCDSLYSWSSMEMLDANCEELTVQPSLFKQFATIYLEVSCFGDAMSDIDMIMLSDVNGIDLCSLAPMRGAFSCKAERLSDSEYRVRIPRQVPGENTLRSDMVRNGVSLVSLPLGEYVSHSGYDWTQQNLQDVYVNVSCMETDMGIEILEWRAGFRKEEVL